MTYEEHGLKLLTLKRQHGSMELGKFLLSSLLFLFSAFMFPDMADAVDAVSASEALKPILTAIPPILLLVVAIIPIYYAVKTD
jgi:hypothetical protein